MFNKPKSYDRGKIDKKHHFPQHDSSELFWSQLIYWLIIVTAPSHGQVNSTPPLKPLPCWHMCLKTMDVQYLMPPGQSLHSIMWVNQFTTLKMW